MPIKQACLQGLGILALSLVVMGASWFLHPQLPAWDPMELEEGEILLQDALALPEVTWIDARPEEAYASDHIHQAVLLNEDDWDRLFEAFILQWTGDSTLVVYCDNRNCSASKSVAARLQEALGIDSIYILKGGWQSWLDHRDR